MRSLSSQNAAAVVLPLTRPVYLVEFDFSTPLRVSSRETITYAGNTFASATVQVDLANNIVRLYNAGLAYTSTFKAGGDGVPVVIWAVYGEPTFTRGSADVMFSGELGAVGFGDWIVARLRESSPKQIPRLTVAPPTFKNLPPDGLEIRTPTGVFTLERG